MTRERAGFVTQVVATLFVAGVASLAAGARTPSAASSSPLVVHEWGTFTSVAGPDGKAIEWLPLSGPSDLPCFVNMMPNSPKGWYPGGVVGTPATIRMETPVLYFYTQEETSARVRVRFPQGVITEWFPSANVSPLAPPRYLRDDQGIAEWTNVQITPRAAETFVSEPADSHYYAARATDASPIKVGGQTEKFLFYRGVAGAAAPVDARLLPDGRVEVASATPFKVPQVVLFENRNGRIGYRIASRIREATTIDAPVLDGSLVSLRADLERMLIEQGLFEKEAKAMVNTWRDSWFEEGTRLFYILSSDAVDAMLPLVVDPQPASVARAFVGRVEVITPAMEVDVEQALVSRDLATLNKYGRVVRPIADRVLAKPSRRIEPGRAIALLDVLAASLTREVSCGTPNR